LTSFKHGFEVPRKTFIYTSGILVYGNQTGIIDETTPFTSPSWRAEIEEKVISTTALNTIVIRPGFVYGGSGGYFAVNWFGPKTKIELAGSPTKRWSWIHIDDLSEAYVQVVNRAAQLNKEIFNIVDYSSPTYEEVLVGLNKAAGFTGTIDHVAAKPGIETYMNVTVVANAAKARRLLGWFPKHLGVLAEPEIYYHSYLATTKK